VLNKLPALKELDTEATMAEELAYRIVQIFFGNHFSANRK
jgi:hypothetical protein